MRLIQSFSDSESKSFQRFGVRKQPSVSRGSGLKLQNPTVQLISEPRDVYNSRDVSQSPFRYKNSDFVRFYLPKEIK